MITWDILTAIQTALSDITRANGYASDVGASVVLEPAQVSDTAPGILVTTSDITGNDDPARSTWQRGMTVQIEAHAPATDADGMQTVHGMLDDIEAAMARQTCLAPIGVSKAQLSSANITAREDGGGLIIGTWTCDITYRRKPG